MNEIDKIVSYFKYLGVRIDMNLFGDRKLFQKLVYLFHEVGLVREDYNFNIYLQGPYSPALANLGFENKNKLKNIATIHNLTDAERRVLERIGRVFGDWITNTDKMELVTSIIFIKKKYGKSWKEKMKRIKPRFSNEKILVAEQRIKEMLFDEKNISKNLKKELRAWDKLSGDLVE